MHLHTIAAFAFLFWRMERPSECYFLSSVKVETLIAFVCFQPALLAILAWISTQKTRRMMARSRHFLGPAAKFHHRSMSMLRLALIVGFGATTLLTPWPDWFSLRGVAPALQVFGDLAVLSMYFL